MFTQTIKTARISQVLGKRYNNVVPDLLMAMLNVDLWIFIHTAQFFRKSVRFMEPFMRTLFWMCIGASLILVHSIVNVPAHLNLIESKPITGISVEYKSLIDRELIQLKDKASSLETTVRKMNLQLQTLCRQDNEQILPDFASEAVGGSIIGTPDTINFIPEGLTLRLFGFPIWAPHYFTPRKIIQPWTQAGECWAFRGANGNIEVQLAYSTLLDSVTLEHIPISASLTKSIDSAPKDFRVLGKVRNKYQPLGTFTYNYHGPPSQTFQISYQEMEKVPVKIVMLQVFSNWGNPDYTCIYRFRVHGKMYDESR